MLSNLEPRRCRCGRLLFKGQVQVIEIKCPRCGAIHHFRDQIPVPERRRASSKDASHGEDQTSPT